MIKHMDFENYFLDCRCCVEYNTQENRCSIDNVDEEIESFYMNEEGWDYADASKADCPFWLPDKDKIDQMKN